ncbi:MAG TPA: choice-of-anchor D domain-containing protein [Acidobacteriaceae bacterium]|nr:choice-of-anchor D domain-containing protein [Acidobacteriaceae bacterium]
MKITPSNPGPHLRASSRDIHLALRPYLAPFRSLLTTIATLLCLAHPLSAQSPPPQLPPNNATLDFAPIFTDQPTIQWIKITQSSPSASVVVTSSTPGTPYLATLVEDTGFDHGQPPPSAFSTSPTGTCLNCWLGIRFTPQATGLETGSITLTPHPIGSPYTLSLTGTGLPTTGLLLTPTTQDFGSLSIHGVSAPILFTVTNLNPAATSINLGNPTTSGDFAAITTPPTGGSICAGPLAYTASCFIEIAFVPTSLGPMVGTLNLQAGPLTATAQLTGTGTLDPGLAIKPAALVFNNVPGPTATQQTLTLTNTSSAPEQISPPTLNSSAFAVSSACSYLPPGTTCTLAITFSPTTYDPSTTASISVTSNGNVTQYTIPLTGNYTTQTAGLQILSSDTRFPPQPLSTVSTPRQFLLNNLTAKPLTLNFAFPRQLALASAPCITLAPFATCTFSAAFVPLTTADTTGSLFVTGVPTDNSPNVTGIAYFESYGTAPTNTDLILTSPNLQSDGTLDFGQPLPGHTSQRTLTLRNPSTLPITIHRITSPWPYLATSDCLAPLTFATSCTITLTYAPINQVPPGSSPTPFTTDNSVLTIESDAASSPNLINLTGSSTPVYAATPTNGPLQPILTSSESSVTFTANTLGAPSPAQSTTFINTGTTPLTITKIASTPDFPVTHNCTTLAPSASCSLTVSFAPQQSSTSTNHIAAIEIASDASTPLEFISLLGIIGTSTLALAPSPLDFGTQLLGTSTTLPVQLTNTGTLPATLFTLTPTAAYTLAPGTCPIVPATLAANTSCTLGITFTPTRTGPIPGTLTLTSSDPTVVLPLNGIGATPPPPPPPPTFTLTVNGAATASATVTAGASATYPLTATPLNGFTGPLALTCTPVNPAPYATCAIQPTSLTLTSSPQSATVTITTQATAAHLAPQPALPGAGAIVACLLLPTFLVAFRKSRRLPTLLILCASLATLTLTACGRIVTPYLRQSATTAGTYTYQVTATSSTAPAQTVTLTLTVH